MLDQTSILSTNRNAVEDFIDGKLALNKKYFGTEHVDNDSLFFISGKCSHFGYVYTNSLFGFFGGEVIDIEKPFKGKENGIGLGSVAGAFPLIDFLANQIKSQGLGQSAENFYLNFSIPPRRGVRLEAQIEANWLDKRKLEGLEDSLIKFKIRKENNVTKLFIENSMATYFQHLAPYLFNKRQTMTLLDFLDIDKLDKIDDFLRNYTVEHMIKENIVTVSTIHPWKKGFLDK